MRLLLPTALATMLLATAAEASIPAPPPEIAPIPVTFLIDLGSGQVLNARQPDLRFVPASMTKVMTAYVAFEEIAAGRLNQKDMLTVRPETSREWKGKGTSMHLGPGETVGVGDLMHGIMTASANDASVVLAEGHAGSISAWTYLMNDAARRLGMLDSRFNTPNGWPDEGKTYVSARDLARLSKAMISRFPQLYQAYCGRKSFVWRGRTLESHDPVSGAVPGADGIKTGFTREAGYNFLGSAERDGRRLVMVLAGARSADAREQAARAFLEWGFSAWRARALFRKGDIVGRVRVQEGDSRSVRLVAGRAIHATLPNQGDSRIALRIIYRGPLRAPIAKGAEVAELEISVDGLPPGRVPLEAAEAIGKADPMDRLWNGLMNMLS